MACYFFHLKLELYQAPAAPSPERQHVGDNASPTAVRAPFLPANDTDIFRAPLPAHRTTKWPSCRFRRRRPSSAGGSDTARRPDQYSASPHHLPPAHDRKDSHGDALLLPERSTALKKTEASPSPRTRPATRHSNAAAAADWRYDSVEIESIDMVVKGSKPNGHTKAAYVPSDSKTTEVGWGVVHLYRDAEESHPHDGGTRSRQPSPHGTAGVRADEGFSIDDCSTLCILAVPSWMMPSDLLGFVGDQAREDVSHFRLIRTGRANKYMVLLKFRSPKKARDWQKAYNGRLFSAAEPENCHVVFIKSVEFTTPEEAPSFHHNRHDPFTASSASKGMLSKPMAPPPPNLLELPTCPVCLERMDETTGLLTILCQHVFHCACLEKWRGSGCPVCRYTHSPSYTFPYPRPGSTGQEDREPMCASCAGTSNLWICLICGNIGCGRYEEAHAFAHYEETSHCYAMDISTQHVWDYAGDGYVHRLIQSKPPPTPAPRDESSHSGLVDMPPRQPHENEAYRAEGGDVVPREKMESMAAEYTYLLTSQLEGQRKYFEEQMERAVDKAVRASQRAEEAVASLAKNEAELAHAMADASQARERLERVEKALAKAEGAKARFEKMARDMTSQYQSEKAINDGLLHRIHAADQAAAHANAHIQTLTREKQDLHDLNHDLTAFITGQEKLAHLQRQGEPVAHAHAYAPEAAAAKATGKKVKK